VFCEDVKHHLRFCLHHLSCVKMAAFQIYFQSGKQSEVGWVWEYSHIVFGKQFPGERGIVRRCGVVMQQRVLLSPKFGAKSSHISTQSPSDITVVSGIDCLACQDEFLVNNSRDVKENYEHALDFILHLSHRSRWGWTFRVLLMLSSPNVCLIIARVSIALFPRFAQNLMLFVC
jgi:hypothetical protein